MRTTVDLPEDLHRIALSLARDRGRTLSQAVAELMRRGLGLVDQPLRSDTRGGFPVVRLGRPITSEDVKALEDEV